MFTSTIQEKDGKFTVDVPADLIQQHGLHTGSSLEVEIVNERLLLRRRRSKYTIEELLAQCDFSLPISEEDKQWEAMPAVGREII